MGVDGYRHEDVEVEEDETNELSISAITLNCWGLLFFSKHRQQRIQSIADYLADQKYDIVFLQELWVKSDFELIRQQTSTIYKFAHLFPTKSIIGRSGLAIMSKWSPSHLSFIPFTVNGSPFRPWHGDWFTGKGTAYVRIDLKNIRIHLFCTHMHAQYCDNEDISHQYSIHRICQSYQLGKFINMTEDLVSDGGKCRELFLLAGDLNTSPEEFPFKLLESITGLHNICHPGSKGSKKDQNDLVTCGHMENSFTDLTSSQSKDETSSRHKQTNQGKQIDFILYKMVNRRNCDRNSTSFSNGVTALPPEFNFNCIAEKLPCLTKDPKTGLSFSDHQPVAVKFVTSNKRQAKEGGDFCGPSSSLNVKRNSLEVTDSANGFGDHGMCHQRNGVTDLQKAAKLMRRYINDNESSRLKSIYSLVLLAVSSVIALIMINYYHDLMPSLMVTATSVLLFIVFGLIMLVVEIAFRFEQHGIKSIIEELDCSLSSFSS